MNSGLNDFFSHNSCLIFIIIDFTLNENKKSPYKTATTVHIGPNAISVEKYSWDKTFESEQTIKAISVSKMLEATGVSDVEALKEYIRIKNGYDEISRFLTRHNIRYEHDGYTRYE